MYDNIRNIPKDNLLKFINFVLGNESQDEFKHGIKNQLGNLSLAFDPTG